MSFLRGGTLNIYMLVAAVVGKKNVADDHYQIQGLPSWTMTQTRSY